MTGFFWEIAYSYSNWVKTFFFRPNRTVATGDNHDVVIAIFFTRFIKVH